MLQILTILLLETQLSMVSALFTVEVPQQLYTAEYGSNVTMECRFPVNGSVDLGLLTVLWERKRQGSLKSKEVYTFRNGKALHSSQHPDYIGRASLLHSKLKMGRAILQITNVKITDAGSYLCLIDYQGVDYKYIALEVRASYKRINTQVMRIPGEDKFVFMCQSEGFPLAEVFWQNQNFNLSGSANTTYTLTANGLYNVTSILTFKPNMSENYTCVFWNRELNGETSAHFSTLAFMSTQYSGQKFLISLIISTCVTVAVLSALIIFKKRKSFKNEQPKKDRKRKLNPNAKAENSKSQAILKIYIYRFFFLTSKILKNM
ncbi:programmed cell death 1 ligand 2 isoform X1 [Motacilla alba alba]|uniref:programmed cell death 1 ligand 2 isoform X1 n=1 Tax=Motacilla alba alba TaxID=1094192 RepID=UPI0018D59D1D|nr:programmed cell death 1 ligand 2 isoform X1 [Motacilla alba alba]XP_037981541.1 programmed cell death 1 ligand 2 isoform X1 [Motacilla alba alba]XP_037981542.1 programmed cell death 1 ligand 2 isoform X1 [Motacilla alba alba]XP_037981544.1 programmed cell death 1 ligand 2 isoform X1 [Motacilla alba alba]XP_037981545.1 programmed cell death 1 ligand 2 isoform X1 [Motacilla alba alba]XP_037981546.1 programmed cell death 1 ligand 2 isoform X1 [Motacilla alba alba]XP_037981547.1 programmed cel